MVMIESKGLVGFVAMGEEGLKQVYHLDQLEDSGEILVLVHQNFVRYSGSKCYLYCLQGKRVKGMGMVLAHGICSAEL